MVNSVQAALLRSKRRGWRFGFVFTAADLFACIDLDVMNEQTQVAKGETVGPANWTTPDEIDRSISPANNFGRAYTGSVLVFESTTRRQGGRIWHKGTATGSADAGPIALTHSLTMRQVAVDLAMGLSTLRRRIRRLPG